MIETFIFLALLAAVFLMGRRLFHLEKKVAEDKKILEDMINVMGQFTALSNVSINKLKECDSRNEQLKDELLDFQRAMAEFCLSVTDFMERIRDSVSASRTGKKDDKPN